MLDSVLKAYQSPTRMVHAVGALSALGKEAAGLNVKRPLVVTDQGIVKAGLLDEALKPLRAEGLDPVTYEQVRAPLRRRDRDEIALLTGQRHVPVLVLGGEAICDSKRIVEHLEWRETRLDAAANRPGTPGSA